MKPDDKKIKLAIVIPNLYKGGAEKVLVSFVNNLDYNKYEPIIFCLKKEGDLIACLNPQVLIEDLNCPRVYFSIRQIRKCLRKHQPDVLIGWMGHVNAVLAFYKFMLPSNLVLLCRESSIPSKFINYYRAPSLFRFLYRFLNRYDGIICQSDAMKQDLVKNFGVAQPKIRVINNPVVTNRNDSKISEEIKEFIQDAEKVLLFVGRFSAEKRISLLSDVMLVLPQTYKLILIGYGPQEKNVRDEIKVKKLANRVHLVTDCSNPSAYYERADCLLLTSAFEGFPNVVLEANAMGCPACIYQTAGGVVEIINEGNGIYISPDSNAGMNDFAEAIKSICTQPLVYIREEIKKSTEIKFGIREIMNQYMNYIGQMVNLKKQ